MERLRSNWGNDILRIAFILRCMYETNTFLVLLLHLMHGLKFNWIISYLYYHPIMWPNSWLYSSADRPFPFKSKPLPTNEETRPINQGQSALDFALLQPQGRPGAKPLHEQISWASLDVFPTHTSSFCNVHIVQVVQKQLFFFSIFDPFLTFWWP